LALVLKNIYLAWFGDNVTSKFVFIVGLRGKWILSPAFIVQPFLMCFIQRLRVH